MAFGVPGRSRPPAGHPCPPSDVHTSRAQSRQSREWLEDPAGAAVPDLDSLQADACGPTYTYDSNTRLKLEAKDHMRARGAKSPDERDAVALTFAEPVAPDARFGRTCHRRDLSL